MTTKKCLQCNKGFIPNTHSHNQKYCSKSCCWKYWDSRRPASRDKYKNEYSKKWITDPINRDRMRIWQRIWQKSQRDSLRTEILKKLGNKCNRCGFTDFRALQIDHVNGGGNKDFRDNYQIGKSRGRRYYYKAVLADETGKYQLLCANCNWIKKHENKEL